MRTLGVKPVVSVSNRSNSKNANEPTVTEQPAGRGRREAACGSAVEGSSGEAPVVQCVVRRETPQSETEANKPNNPFHTVKA
jgi:hypothetical protein